MDADWNRVSGGIAPIQSVLRDAVKTSEWVSILRSVPRRHKKRAAHELNSFLAVQRRTRCNFVRGLHPLFKVVGAAFWKTKAHVLKCRIFAGIPSELERLVATGALAPETNAMPLWTAALTAELAWWLAHSFLEQDMQKQEQDRQRDEDLKLGREIKS